MKINASRAVLKGKFKDNKKIKSCLLTAAWESNLSVIKYVEHEFHPKGYSLIILLAESHLSIHTFPEKDEAVVDCLTCGNKKAKPVLVKLAKLLDAEIKGKKIK